MKNKYGRNIKTADVGIVKGGGIIIMTTRNWYIRLWYFISNPFRYLFTGKIRY